MFWNFQAQALRELAVSVFIFLEPSRPAVRKLTRHLEEERLMWGRSKVPSLEQHQLPDERVWPSWTCQLNVRVWRPQASPGEAKNQPAEPNQPKNCEK